MSDKVMAGQWRYDARHRLVYRVVRIRPSGYAVCRTVSNTEEHYWPIDGTLGLEEYELLVTPHEVLDAYLASYPEEDRLRVRWEPSDLEGCVAMIVIDGNVAYDIVSEDLCDIEDMLTTVRSDLNKPTSSDPTPIPTHKATKKYVDWASAGGPDECSHGYAAGIPCPHCDAMHSAATVFDGEPVAVVLPEGTYAYQCEDCHPTQSETPLWNIFRVGDAVVSWSCDAHLGGIVHRMFNRSDREFRITPFCGRPALAEQKSTSVEGDAPSHPHKSEAGTTQEPVKAGQWRKSVARDGEIYRVESVVSIDAAPPYGRVEWRAFGQGCGAPTSIEATVGDRLATPREVLDAFVARLPPDQRARVVLREYDYFHLRCFVVEVDGHGTNTVTVVGRDHSVDGHIDRMLAAICAALAKYAAKPKTRTEIILAKYADNKLVTWTYEANGYIYAIISGLKAAWWSPNCDDERIRYRSADVLCACIDAALAAAPKVEHANAGNEHLDTPTRDECAHGGLRRKCEICQRDAEIAELEERIAELEARNNELIHECGMLNQECNLRTKALQRVIDNDVTYMREDRDRVKAELDNATSTNKLLLEDVRALQNELSAKPSEWRAVFMRTLAIESDSGTAEEAEYHINRMRERITGLEKENIELSTLNVKIGVEMATMAIGYHSLRVSENNRMSRIDDLQKECDGLVTALSRLAADAADAATASAKKVT